MDAHVEQSSPVKSTAAAVKSTGAAPLLILAAATVIAGLSLLVWQQTGAYIAIELCVACAIAGIATTAALRAMLSARRFKSIAGWQRFAIWVAPASASMLAIMVVAAGAAPVAAAVLAGILLVVEGASWHWLNEPHTPQHTTAVASSSQQAQPTLPRLLCDEEPSAVRIAQLDTSPRPLLDEGLAGEPVEEEPEALPEGVVQQLTRSIDENGHDVLYGAMRVRFETGGRAQTVHVAFCPPLQSAPAVMAGVLDGPSATVKTVESQTFGCSLEIRLSAKSAGPCEVVFEFFASAPDAMEAA